MLIWLHQAILIRCTFVFVFHLLKKCKQDTHFLFNKTHLNLVKLILGEKKSCLTMDTLNKLVQVSLHDFLSDLAQDYILGRIRAGRQDIASAPILALNYGNHRIYTYNITIMRHFLSQLHLKARISVLLGMMSPDGHVVYI